MLDLLSGVFYTVCKTWQYIVLKAFLIASGHYAVIREHKHIPGGDTYGKVYR